MKIILTVFFCLLIYLFYGAFFLDFAKKHHEIAMKSFPSFLFFIRNPKVYDFVYKSLIIVAIIITTTVFLLISNPKNTVLKSLIRDISKNTSQK